MESFILSFVPPELINLILLRLPIKSLLRFRCLSKSWLSLISNVEFIKNHRSISTNNNDCTHHRLILHFNPPQDNLKDCSLSSLLHGSVTEASDLDCPMKKACKSIEIVGSFNGLVCLATEGQGLFIWNPSLRKSKKLPDSGIQYYYMYGFGYDELHDDYKVLVGVRGWTNGEVKIYSLNSNSWRSIDDSYSDVLDIESGVFVSGKLHWWNNNYDFHWGISSIDLTDGKWGKVEQPSYNKGDFNTTLGVLGSDLSVFCTCYYQRIHEVWVMKEYGVKVSWTKMFTINFHDNPMSKFSPFFCMSNKGEILFTFGSTFMIYNPKDDSIRYAEVTHYDADFEANIYIESLVWPFFTDGTRMQ